jgi:hypothetical protein
MTPNESAAHALATEIVRIEKFGKKYGITEAGGWDVLVRMANDELAAAQPLVHESAAKDLPPEDCQWMSYARGGNGWCACGRLGSEKSMVPYAAFERHMQGNQNNPAPAQPATEGKLREDAEHRLFEANVLVGKIQKIVREALPGERWSEWDVLDQGVLQALAQVRREALEEAAKIADDFKLTAAQFKNDNRIGALAAGKLIAEDIRALAAQPTPARDRSGEGQKEKQND